MISFYGQKLSCLDLFNGLGVATLGGSRVVISGVICRVTIIITHLKGLITLLTIPMNLLVQKDDWRPAGNIFLQPFSPDLWSSTAQGLGFRVKFRV